jgi:hypothetical protein
MVRVELAVPEPGVMLSGENEQLNVLGSPLQESLIAAFALPDCIAAVTVITPDFPLGRVKSFGAAVKAIVAGVTGGSGSVGTVVFGHVGE